MKIAIVNRHLADFIGGSEMQCANIAEELIARGHKVTYIAVDGERDRDYGVDYAVEPASGSARAIVAAVLKAEPDIVYWRMNKFHFRRAAKAIKAHGIAIIFAISHINDTRRFHHYFHRKDLKTKLRAAKQALTNAINFRGFYYVDAVTSLNKNYLNKVPVAKQKLILNCVDTRQEKFSWPRPFVMWVATIKAAKRPEKFVELAKLFAADGIDFLMVGPLTDAGYSWLGQAGVSPNFHYLGAKTPQEVNGMLQESLFLVHTCLPEGFGNIFIQAWFCGKPTLSLGYDPADIIMQQRLGADSRDDWDDFVAQTHAYITDEVLRNEAGKRAQGYAEQTFSVKRTVDELFALMQDVTRKS